MTLKLIWTWIERNRGAVVAGVLAVSFAGWSYGCQPKAADPRTGEPVTMDALATSWDIFVADHDATFTRMALEFTAAGEDIEKQSAMWRAVWQSVMPAITAMAGPAAAPILAVFGGLFTAGLTYDNTRKGWVIKTQRAKAAPAGAAS